MAPKDAAQRPRKGKGQLLFDWPPPVEADASKHAGPLTEAGSVSSVESRPNGQPDSTAVSDTMPSRDLRQTTETLPELPPETTDTPSFNGYDPSHPWFYYHKGHNGPPVPFDSIPANEEAFRAMDAELPKSAAKRAIKAREFLAVERKELEQARLRYEDIAARGPEALSRYDREIAYGGDDDMARAGSLALLYNQISLRRGRIAALECFESRDNSRSR